MKWIYGKNVYNFLEHEALSRESQKSNAQNFVLQGKLCMAKKKFIKFLVRIYVEIVW